jgi:hypothetical protein
MKFFIVQSSPAFCYVLPLRSKYAQHPDIKHSPSVFNLRFI